jgi:hypothetical protein
MNWHAPTELLDAYVRGDLDHASGMSIEAHTLRCEQCRARLTELAAPLVHRTWDGIADAIDIPRPHWIERWLERIGVSASSARLIGTTPAMRTSWFLATLLSLGFGVFLSHAASGSGRSLPFLMIAPLMPVLAIAAAYGSPLGRLDEIEQATPYRPWRMLLLRSMTVLVVCVAASAVLSLAIPGPTARAWLWLAPALALSTLVLALSTWVSLPRAAIATGALWIVVILACAVLRADSNDAVFGRFVMFRPAGQVSTIAVALVSSLLFATRSRRVDPFLGRLS